MLRFILIAPLVGHGLAHFSGVLASWTTSEVGYSNNPWIFSADVNLNAGVGRVFGLIWLMAMLGLVCAGLGILFRQDWWIPVAMASTSLSLLAIVPWWNSVPPGAKLGALFNLLLLAALLLPTKDFLLKAVE